MKATRYTITAISTPKQRRKGKITELQLPLPPKIKSQTEAL